MSENEKHSLLIVDDGRANIRVLSHALLPEYTVFVARDGQSAIEKAKSLAPDLILLDILMPDMSGYEVIVELKNTESTREIPVIFITELSDIEDEEKGFLLGAVDYIVKPFNSTIVRARVQQHLQTLRQLRMIKRLGILDPLTDIPNRRGFNERLEAEWNKAIREESRIALLMIDIDHFKRYNDTYGHPQGDKLLQTIAGVFRQALTRPADYLARWGGEEFAVVLPGTDAGSAMEIAERIRAHAEDAVIPCAGGTDTRVTVSIGVHAVAPVAGDLPDDFIAKADKALYTAKETGRNRVAASRD